MRVYGPLQRRFLDNARTIIPTSQEYADTSETLRPHLDRCRVVPLGIVSEAFANPGQTATDKLRDRYGGEFVLFSGRHRYYKGLNHLVEAAQQISAPVVIAGDGPERATLQFQAKSLGAPVHFPGELDDSGLVAHLHACAVFAFPSIARSEAFGISILEAHACARPVVATMLGTGVEFANLDGITGVNVPPGNSAALAGAINRLLSDPAERATMGRQAQERVRSLFRAEDIARREFELYQEALT
jgi:rhamnosyl/mannosyltransferase